MISHHLGAATRKIVPPAYDKYPSCTTSIAHLKQPALDLNLLYRPTLSDLSVYNAL